MSLLKFNSPLSRGCTSLVLVAMLMAGCGAAVGNSKDHATTTTQGEVRDHAHNPYWSPTDTATLNVPKSEWKKILPPDLYNVAFDGGTERAFTGKYTDYKGDGTFVCAVCGHPLYDARTEFHSGTGWPSFHQPLTPSAVGHRSDGSLGMERTEIVCPRCGAHLGHVFEDGPQPTGLRYCMNSVSLDLVK
ncbi:MAG TPA: peptide-methionine (R)-S-oxide reductase MsrB [Flavobacteriales bacterium]|nr:peptide-methionine (R)-S-oxide reductase MsrB [Flavobacteriales bacterium]HQW30987.1 peptide-methionine (R)-S-oxide reductase MsrB [Flavobacteriales bacterium]HQY02615.1 peptide-methionine (R)-S-oxide reductase MsrB [Flavobacteriales bacterium]HQY79304.1 peptide-methionine (R)-S-oxide reductase MsrB [Flavobacteriales bacterium]HRA16293.1 peptide-methionine (R)-S-oxide reductase MsrB [Flavobacteriales bacterium]